ncbi:hypothetical protein ACIP5N_20555 [Streptomyces sp. NPDC088768]|uniref:hypothetical protein n=1 Tax=Streptomyces sp. NPDC088768 TaxID=3365894 RepID=UPI00380BD7AC
MYAPRSPPSTGHQGDLGLPALRDFTASLRAHSHAPVVGGLGISSPQLAEQGDAFVEGAVIGPRASGRFCSIPRRRAEPCRSAGQVLHVRPAQGRPVPSALRVTVTGRRVCRHPLREKESPS